MGSWSNDNGQPGRRDAGKSDGVPGQKTVTKLRWENDGNVTWIQPFSWHEKKKSVSPRKFSRLKFSTCYLFLLLMCALFFFDDFFSTVFFRSLKSVRRSSENFSDGLIPQLLPGILLNPLHCLISRTWNCEKVDGHNLLCPNQKNREKKCKVFGQIWESTRSMLK